MEILEIHSKCLDFLLDYQLKTPDFYFVPRKINNKNLLAQGMYFRGNNKANKLIIVTVLEPTKEDMEYLQGLRDAYQIPVYYQQFDMDKKILLKEF